MKKKFFTWGCACLSMVVMSCGSSLPLVVKSTEHQAGFLKKYCTDHKVKSVGTQTADSLYTAAVNQLLSGDAAQAYGLFDLAVMHYRLAILQKELETKKSNLIVIKSALEKEKKELGAYQQVLDELKEMRNAQ